jgi:UDP-N-acetyl-D-mannosaminuronic acid dehydrogenase
VPLAFRSIDDYDWSVRKIAVVGPGIVGMPMAAMLADAPVRIGSDAPAHIVVLQRRSPTSGWKVDAINAGRSVIGGVEPGLDDMTRRSVAAGRLSASYDYADAADADVILVSIQTDKKGLAPDYGPLFEGLEGIAAALRTRPAGNVPIVVFESTLAPSSMQTVVRELFARHGLIEGRDVLLGNSPNRVMPGRLVDRVAASDKLVAGLHPLTPVLVQRLYRTIVTRGVVHPTRSLTAEVVKTLENAYRDVRIAFSAEIVRWCDSHDVSFYAVRDEINRRIAQPDAASTSATTVPVGGMLVPTLGVGGHCLPKDGILLWWRAIEQGVDSSASLILKSRAINDESPAATVALAERALGALAGRAIALLGAAYRFDSEDTRNSPTIALAQALAGSGCAIRIHDPYVPARDANLAAAGLADRFTNDLDAALDGAEVAFACTGHGVYLQDVPGRIVRSATLRGLVDAANAFRAADFAAGRVRYVGVGRGRRAPEPAFLEFVERSFRVVEHGVANEVSALLGFLNTQYAPDAFNRVTLDEVRTLAATCPTGCAIAATRVPLDLPEYHDFASELARCAVAGAVAA